MAANNLLSVIHINIYDMYFCVHDVPDNVPNFHHLYVYTCDIHAVPVWKPHGANTGLNLGLRPANERQCYFITKYLIGWAQA